MEYNKFQNKWGWTRDEECYHGAFDTPEEAAADGLGKKGGRITVGKYRAPTPPEQFIDADLIIEHATCQDEYSGPWAEDCIECSPAQAKELTEALQKTFGDWLDKHDLRPTFGIIEPETVKEIALAPETGADELE